MFNQKKRSYSAEVVRSVCQSTTVTTWQQLKTKQVELTFTSALNPNWSVHSKAPFVPSKCRQTEKLCMHTKTASTC